jgi:hypothetical protein
MGKFAFECSCSNCKATGQFDWTPTVVVTLPVGKDGELVYFRGEYNSYGRFMLRVVGNDYQSNDKQNVGEYDSLGRVVRPSGMPELSTMIVSESRHRWPSGVSCSTCYCFGTFPTRVVETKPTTCTTTATPSKYSPRWPSGKEVGTRFCAPPGVRVFMGIQLCELAKLLPEEAAKLEVEVKSTKDKSSSSSSTSTSLAHGEEEDQVAIEDVPDDAFPMFPRVPGDASGSGQRQKPPPGTKRPLPPGSHTHNEDQQSSSSSPSSSSLKRPNADSTPSGAKSKRSKTSKTSDDVAKSEVVNADEVSNQNGMQKKVKGYDFTGMAIGTQEEIFVGVGLHRRPGHHGLSEGRIQYFSKLPLSHMGWLAQYEAEHGQHGESLGDFFMDTKVDKLQGMFPHNVDERYDQAKEVWRNDMRGGGNGEGCFIQ